MEPTKSSNYPTGTGVHIVGPDVPEPFRGLRGTVVEAWQDQEPAVTVSAYLGDYRVQIDLAAREVEPV